MSADPVTDARAAALRLLVSNLDNDATAYVAAVQEIPESDCTELINALVGLARALACRPTEHPTASRKPTLLCCQGGRL